MRHHNEVLLSAVIEPPRSSQPSVSWTAEQRTRTFGPPSSGVRSVSRRKATHAVKQTVPEDTAPKPAQPGAA